MHVSVNRCHLVWISLVDEPIVTVTLTMFDNCPSMITDLLDGDGNEPTTCGAAEVRDREYCRVGPISMLKFPNLVKKATANLGLPKKTGCVGMPLPLAFPNLSLIA